MILYRLWCDGIPTPGYCSLLYTSWLHHTLLRACTASSARKPCSEILRVDLVCGIPFTSVSQILVYSFVQGKSEKIKVQQLWCENNARRFENTILPVCLLRVLRRILRWHLMTIGCKVCLYLILYIYCVPYHVARNGTIVPRALQFVYHMCTLRLVDVLRAQTKSATLSNYQNWYLVLCNYQTNL